MKDLPTAGLDHGNSVNDVYKTKLLQAPNQPTVVNGEAMDP